MSEALALAIGKKKLAHKPIDQIVGSVRLLEDALRTAAALGLPDLRGDPRVCPAAARLGHADVLARAVAPRREHERCSAGRISSGRGPSGAR